MVMFVNEEICWCGSSKKLKECHIGRRNKKRKTHLEQQALIRQAMSSLSYCSASRLGGCDALIKSAHTIQRSKVLSAISESGHVGSFHRTKESKRVSGISKQASVFNGFCSEHDNTLFSCIENSDFDYSYSSAMASTYRAISYELYNKRSVIECLNQMRGWIDNGLSRQGQLYEQHRLSGQIFASGLDLKYVDGLHEEAELYLKDTSERRFSIWAVTVKSVPLIATCGVISIKDGCFFTDFNSPLDESKREMIAISTCICDGKFVYVIAALSSGAESCGFLSKILEDKDSAGRNIGGIALGLIENTYFKSTWFTNLPGVTQETAEKSALSVDFGALSHEKIFISVGEVESIRKINN